MISLSNKPSDKELIEAIQSGGTTSERAMNYLYEAYKGFNYKALKKFRKLNFEEIQDRYAVSLVQLRNQVRLNAFHNKSKLSTYFYQIFKRRCLDAIKEKSTNKYKQHMNALDILAMDYQNELRIMPDTEWLNIDHLKWLVDLMPKAGARCLEVIIARHYYGFSAEEIAEQQGFKNAKTVRSKLSTCLNQLRQLIGDRRND